MQTRDNTPAVRALMIEFADRTGLRDPHKPPRRYLWTDAHAVCTLLTLYDATGDDTYRDLALALIDQVHAVLGRHRDDDPRAGWISGLSEEEGREHPTAGGLRIGKKLNERRRDEPVDERLEWDRDGQYFHYLTKWMHALCRTSVVLGESTYSRWALELAKAAWTGFVVAVPGGNRLYWKMSIDLSYPLVASSGHHDPLDGYVTYQEIARLTKAQAGLDAELRGLAAMIAGREWSTTDPLGIGGLLFDACRVLQLTAAGWMDGSDLAETLVRAADESLGGYARDSSLHLPAQYRLAFRELGLSIGLHAVELMSGVVDGSPGHFDAAMKRGLRDLRHYLPIAPAIEAFWQQAENQQSRTWQEHADINAVTLATSLLPNEFLAA